MRIGLKVMERHADVGWGGPQCHGWVKERNRHRQAENRERTLGEKSGEMKRTHPSATMSILE